MKESKEKQSGMVYTFNNFRFEEQGAVVGFSSEFIDHAYAKMVPDSQPGDSAMEEIRGIELGKPGREVLGGHYVVVEGGEEKLTIPLFKRISDRARLSQKIKTKPTRRRCCPALARQGLF